MQPFKRVAHLTGMMVSDLAVEELARARGITDDVLKIVQPDSLYVRPIPLRHRLIFYLGHLEALTGILSSNT